MPHISDVIKLLDEAHSELVSYDAHLCGTDCYSKELANLIERIEQTLTEWERLQAGHLARI